MTKLSIVLKQLRESKNITIEDLAKKAGIGKGTVGDIETDRNKSTVKTLNKISIALELTSEEKNLLDSAFLGRKVTEVTDSRVINLNRKDRFKLEDILSESSLFFNDEKITSEDKKKLLDSITELFFDAKSTNKLK